MSSSSRSSGRLRRPPATFGNAVSSDQAYGSDDNFENDNSVLESEDDESWDKDKAHVTEKDDDISDEEASDEEDHNQEKTPVSKKDKGGANGTDKAKSTKSKADGKKTKTLLPGSAKTLTSKGVVPAVEKATKPLLAKKTTINAKSSKGLASASEKEDTDTTNGDGDESAASKSGVARSGALTVKKTAKPLLPVKTAKPLLITPKPLKTYKSVYRKSGPSKPKAQTEDEVEKPKAESEDEVEKPKVESEDEVENPAGNDDDDAEEDDSEEDKPFTPKRKRSGRSDSTPRKLAPAEKVTPEMRVRIINLFLTSAYNNTVDFNAIGASFKIPGSKLKRHWREVLGPDACAFVKDGTGRTERASSKGGIEKQHRLVIWKEVAKAYEGAKWGELAESTGMSATKLRRHFRDVLNKDVAKMIAKE